MRRGAALSVMVAIGWLAGCESEPPTIRVPLLENPIPVTLGSDTRWANGPGAVTLFHGEVNGFEDLPRFMAIPPALAETGQVVLHYRTWHPPEPPHRTPVEARRRTLQVPVEGGTARPRVRLKALKGLLSEPPLTLLISALPVESIPIVQLRTSLSVPEGASVEFGYGLREESWGSGAPTTRFELVVRESDEEKTRLFGLSLDPDNPAHHGWFEGRFSLSRFVGKRVVVELTAASQRGEAAPALPLWANPVIEVPAPVPPPTNVVLVSLDTLRSRNIGAYGYGRDTTPFFDEIAATGSVFQNAMAPSVTTGPSHMSLFTGLYPPRHGMRLGLEPISPDALPLAEILVREGFQTAAFTENGYLVRERGFGRGFQRYVENRGDEKNAPGQAPLTFSQARRWLERSARPPFFLFVHTYEVHSPFAPREPYATLFEDDGAAGPAEPGMRDRRDDYDREIRGLDDELRGLFDSIRVAGLDDSTWIVLLSDHGEEFGEHGHYQHGGAVYEESLGVPLVFLGPGIAAARHHTPVSLIDVAPTLIELLGIPLPAAIDGRSLAGVVTGASSPEPRALFAEARADHRWIEPWLNERWNPPLVAVRQGDDKFIAHRPASGDASPLLRFDLASDPQERRPLPIEDARAREINALVDAYLGAGTGPRGAGDTLDPDTITPGLEERLRQLGYVK
jgi:arylsulfatase A-like enzyme